MSKLKAKVGGKKSSKKTDAGKPLERSPSHLLHRALQLALDIYAEETGPDTVTQRQYAVLAAVAAQEGLTQTDLVRATGIDRSTLADLVARMIVKDLLARQRSAADARANTVRLTDAGRAALSTAAPRVTAADARILKLLPARKRDAFIDVLQDIGRAAETLTDAETADDIVAPKVKKKKKDKSQARGGDEARVAAKAKIEKPAKAAKPPKPAVVAKSKKTAVAAPPAPIAKPKRAKKAVDAPAA